jgi:hypothetical protein
MRRVQSPLDLTVPPMLGSAAKCGTEKDRSPHLLNVTITEAHALSYRNGGANACWDIWKIRRRLDGLMLQKNSERSRNDARGMAQSAAITLPGRDQHAPVQLA